jgi:acyl carrier protein
MNEILFTNVTKIISTLLSKPELQKNMTKETVLRHDLGIDSLLTMDLILLLEEEMNVMIPANMLTAENLRTVGGICSILNGLL